MEDFYIIKDGEIVGEITEKSLGQAINTARLRYGNGPTSVQVCEKPPRHPDDLEYKKNQSLKPRDYFNP